MPEPLRADRALARAGLARSRTEAAALIRGGRALADGAPIRRPSQQVSAQARLSLTDDAPRYVSRAAHKLVSALEAFPVAVAGRRALDAGASTGGFTQVLLERGAASVAAVDVGHDQLAPAVRHDRRVLVREGLNVRALTLEDIDGPVDLVVSDLSFISLRLVVGPLAGVCTPGADLLLMVKPQFEVGRAALPRTGVVTDPHARREAVAAVAAEAAAHGLTARGVARSGLPGQDGNVEFFLHLRADGAAGPGPVEAPPGMDEVLWS
ncbi:TlyA family RNA methyltransferase [Micrococcus sp.]|uniref:TlyA family RNA methyltransferase n=1 Tax=Micrococcus sp. TaxID=1271 RepID=UPI002A91DF60|nr:TlyA family RNA methyltransferase [Micrococcus sp.]MDY6054918.1 TlyA family RNA methyltransferase [Micrococcus sp.]